MLDILIFTLIFAVGFASGYGIRDHKSKLRHRRASWKRTR
jgi:hypothetical protein